MSVALCGAIGATIWACSRPLTGSVEAFDAPVYYSVSLFLGGFLGMLPAPHHRNVGAAVVAIWVGQLAYCLLMLAGGPLWLVGAGMTLMCTLLLALPGALLAVLAADKLRGAHEATSK